MILTGKCKEEFKKWFSINYKVEPLALDYVGRFKNLPFSFQYGVYVDFFDSVGIYIQIGTPNIHNDSDFYYWIDFFDVKK